MEDNDDRSLQIALFAFLLLVAVLVVATCIWKIVNLIALYHMESKIEEIEQSNTGSIENGGKVVISADEARQLRRLSILAGVGSKWAMASNMTTTASVQSSSSEEDENLDWRERHIRKKKKRELRKKGSKFRRKLASLISNNSSAASNHKQHCNNNSNDHKLAARRSTLSIEEAETQTSMEASLVIHAPLETKSSNKLFDSEEIPLSTFAASKANDEFEANLHYHHNQHHRPHHHHHQHQQTVFVDHHHHHIHTRQGNNQRLHFVPPHKLTSTSISPSSSSTPKQQQGNNRASTTTTATTTSTCAVHGCRSFYSGDKAVKTSPNDSSWSAQDEVDLDAVRNHRDEEDDEGESDEPPPPPPPWLPCSNPRHAHQHPTLVHPHVHRCHCGASFPNLPVSIVAEPTRAVHLASHREEKSRRSFLGGSQPNMSEENGFTLADFHRHSPTESSGDDTVETVIKGRRSNTASLERRSRLSYHGSSNKRRNSKSSSPAILRTSQEALNTHHQQQQQHHYRHHRPSSSCRHSWTEADPVPALIMRPPSGPPLLPPPPHPASIFKLRPSCSDDDETSTPLSSPNETQNTKI